VPQEGSLAGAWEHHAESWIRWARASAHDGFWGGTWPQLRRVLPPPRGLVIDVGCGEGRLARQLHPLGYRVVGVEQSETLARAAATGEPATVVVRGDASRLPLPGGAADLVVACMVLMDVDDLGAAVAEIARVLRPGGTLCSAIVHPFASAQAFESVHDDDPPVITEPYLAERRYEDRVQRDGHDMTFVSMHRPLGAYLDAWEAEGLGLRELVEFGDRLLPWLLVTRSVKRP